MLYMLVYYGGMTDGWKKVGGPNSFAITTAEPSGHPGVDRNVIARQYQTASATYFQEQRPQEIGLFLDKIAKILTLPDGR